MASCLLAATVFASLVVSHAGPNCKQLLLVEFFLIALTS
jgi:hypothetical protein